MNTPAPTLTQADRNLAAGFAGTWSEETRPYRFNRLPVRRPADGRATFHYCLVNVPLTCEIYWEREEKQTWTEPGWPATATLESADCGGLNILEILSDDQIAEIETAFLEQEA